jgi:hypothetical protein
MLQVLDPMGRLGAGDGGIQAIKQHPFFSSVDFDTIWTVEPPTLETGIAPPPPRPTPRNVFPDIDWEVSELNDELGSEASSDADMPPSSGPVVEDRHANGIAWAPNGTGAGNVEEWAGEPAPWYVTCSRYSYPRTSD